MASGPAALPPPLGRAMYRALRRSVSNVVKAMDRYSAAVPHVDAPALRRREIQPLILKYCPQHAPKLKVPLQELEGSMWWAHYGVFGLERVQLKIYPASEGQEGRVEAVKLTGDAEVPSGQWTWKSCNLPEVSGDAVPGFVQTANEGFQNPSNVEAYVTVYNTHTIFIDVPSMGDQKDPSTARWTFYRELDPSVTADPLKTLSTTARMPRQQLVDAVPPPPPVPHFSASSSSTSRRPIPPPVVGPKTPQSIGFEALRLLNARVQNMDAMIAKRNQAVGELNRLFSDLSKATEVMQIQRIQNKIFGVWQHSGDQELDVLMSKCVHFIDQKFYSEAFSFANQMVDQAPEWAETWNKRATLRFLVNSLDGAVADIERTLQIEPRHFGALMGLAQTYRRQRKKDAAIGALKQYLEVVPGDRGAKELLRTWEQEAVL